MSLTTGAATSDRITVDSSLLPNLKNLASFMWLWAGVVTTITAGRRFASACSPTADAKFLQVSGTQNVAAQVNRATTNAALVTTSNPLAVGQAVILVLTYSEANGPKVYHGLAGGAIQEATYSGGAPTVGAGATLDDNGLWRIQNGFSNTVALQGRGSRFAVWGAELNVNQINAVARYVLSRSDLALWFELGYAGIGDQPNWAGDRSTGAIVKGIVTGATQGQNHLWLGNPFPQPWGRSYRVIGGAPPANKPDWLRRRRVA